MGFGDVKLAVFLGVLVGWPLVWLNLLLAIWVGGAFGLAVLALKMGDLKSRLPFGTFLALAALITLIWGQGLWDWYLGFLGI